MNTPEHRRRIGVFTILSILLISTSFRAEPREALQASSIGVNGFFSADKAQRGKTIQGAIVVSIPTGLHINSNQPRSKFLIPTSLKISNAGSLRVGAVSYPRPQIRTFSFSPESLSVFEGRAVLRFSVTVPASASIGVTELRARIRYQSCNDEACFPPVTRDVTMPISVVDKNESVKQINRYIFGGRRG